MTNTNAKKNATENRFLSEWVDEAVRLTKPDRVYWCDGTEEERQRLTEEAVADGVLIPLNQKKLPGCYLHRSNPNDVARVEHLTFICTPTKDDAGPTNNWMAPDEAYAQARRALRRLDEGPHDVRRALRDGPARLAVLQGRRRAHRQHLRRAQHADHDAHGQASRSRCSATSQRLQPRPALARSTATPSAASSATFPQDNTIWSVGSGYGGNVLLGKKCLALRIGSYLGKQEGWLAEHMLILGVESPEGEMTYVAAAFPSACGKTNFAMMIPPQALQGLEDLDRRRRHRVDARRRRTAASGRSIPRPATSASRRAPAPRPTRTR